MHVVYDKLVLTEEIAGYMREVIKGTVPREIPMGWSGLIVYHNASNSYYSSKSQHPIEYEKILRTHQPPSRWEGVALALRRLLEQHPDYQFFVLPVVARPKVEHWLALQGKGRIATKMGDAAEDYHVLFKVTSPFNKFTRYVAAPSRTLHKDLIAKANISINHWLASFADLNRHERNVMRVALRAQTKSFPAIFEEKSEVTPTSLLNGRTHNEFRAITMQMNIGAIQEFIRKTTHGG
jgi:hypothetical protein